MDYLKLFRILILLAFPIGGLSQDFQWKVEVVDQIGNGNRQMGFNLDSANNPTIFYTGCYDKKCSSWRENSLKSATKTATGEWKITVLDEDSKKKNTGWFTCSLPVQDKNSYYVFYSNHSSRSLEWLLHQNSVLGGVHVEWKKTILPQDGGWWISCAQNSTQLFIAHTKFLSPNFNNPALEVGVFENGQWKFSTVDQRRDTGWFTRMALDLSGNPIVTYLAGGYFEGDLMLAQMTGPKSWQTYKIDTEVLKNDIKVDPTGFIHVVYDKKDFKHKNKRDLWHATNFPDGKWKSDLIFEGWPIYEDTGGFPSLAIDPNGGLHVTFKDDSKLDLFYARNVGAGWQVSAVDTEGATGLYSHLLVDSKGVLHVSYEDGKKLLYATCVNCIADHTD